MATTLGIKVDAQTRERLAALAAATDRTPHWILKTALSEYLAREERANRERAEDQERWDRYCLTGEAVPHAAVDEWLRTIEEEGSDPPCPR